jgi:hypothetical protein
MIALIKYYICGIFCIWFLLSNSFILLGQASQVQTPIMIANSTLFRVVTTHSNTTPITSTHVYRLTSEPNRSGEMRSPNTYVHKNPSVSFNLPTTTFVPKLPQMLFSSFTVTNTSSTRSESVSSANTILNYNTPKVIHGAKHSPLTSTNIIGSVD